MPPCKENKICMGIRWVYDMRTPHLHGVSIYTHAKSAWVLEMIRTYLNQFLLPSIHSDMGTQTKCHETNIHTITLLPAIQRVERYVSMFLTVCVNVHQKPKLWFIGTITGQKTGFIETGKLPISGCPILVLPWQFQSLPYVLLFLRWYTAMFAELHTCGSVWIHLGSKFLYCSTSIRRNPWPQSTFFISLVLTYVFQKCEIFDGLKPLPSIVLRLKNEPLIRRKNFFIFSFWQNVLFLFQL